MTIVTLTMNPTIDVAVSAERVVPERKLRCSAPKRDAGGGGINVARVLTRLGMKCKALFPAGGLPGEMLRRLVAAEGIEEIVVPIEADTRDNFTAFDEENRRQYRFVLPGPELTPSEWQACLDRLAALAPVPAYVVASGSLPPGVPDDFLARAARVVAKLGSRFVIDTSGAPLKAVLEERVHIIKPNLGELERLIERKLATMEERAAAAAELVQSGKAEVVALTLAAEGAVLAAQDLLLHAKAPPVDLVSAVGAGDSFLAAMIWRLASGGDLADAFRYGVASGSAALLTPGTELSRKEDIHALYDQVAVKAIGGTVAASAAERA